MKCAARSIILFSRFQRIERVSTQFSTHVDRLKDVKGKKSIVLIATGRDTFSKHTYDQTMKALRQTDVHFTSSGMSKVIQTCVNALDTTGSEIDFVQDENQMKTFAKETGGFAWFPQFDRRNPRNLSARGGVSAQPIQLDVRPTNRARDGKFRKVKVELVAPDGSPFTLRIKKARNRSTWCMP